MQWHHQPTDQVLTELQSKKEGLAASAIPALLQQHGPNELIQQDRRSRIAILLAQFKDIMIIILAIAAGISFAAGDAIDGFVILAIIIGNAIMGYIQENKAEESIAMLRKMASGKALVLRDGKKTEIETKDIVPGDVVHLEAGNVVPADARLITINALKTDEAPLTGESVPVDKTVDPIPDENISIADQTNMVFKGTLVSNGTADAVITATGMNTEIGKIAGMLNTEERKTPLQKRLLKFSKQLAFGVLIICVGVFALGLSRGEPMLLMFMTALSLAVAALPEALPAVITIALANGARRMVKQNALIRNLPAVETLGSITYICTDKTGTLTQNVMHVEKLLAVEGQDDLLLHALALNQDLQKTEDGKLHGDSTELAMVEYAEEKGITRDAAEQKYPLTGKIPFDSERMRMSTLHTDGDKALLIVKGAPGKIMEVTTMDQAAKDKWLEQNKQWASEGLRVLLFGYQHINNAPADPKPDIEKDIQLLGMVGLIDPPRDEVIDAIRQCKTAGIKVLMITGDQPLTADAIAHRLEIKAADAPKALTGADLEKMDAATLKKTITEVNVYARVSPEQKVTIVKSLQDAGQFVSMTGDGVNDAPSLKQADIGVAMGITGTEVAKESADMILMDDHFNTIVNAVKEGRRIYENIRKFILYVLSCNAAEILVILCAPFLGLVVPLLPTHILWINLMTDGLPGLALTAEPAEKNVMNQPPRPPNENIFARGMGLRIILTGSWMAAVCLAMQYILAQQNQSEQIQQSFIFTLLCFAQLGNAVVVRSNQFIFNRSGEYKNWRLWYAIALIVALQLILIYVPFAQSIFKTTALSMSLAGWMVGGLVVMMAGFEIIRMLIRDSVPTRSSEGKDFA
jgi:Ca2+-transporting ATPase